MAGNQLPKVHGANEALNQGLNPEIQVKREGIPTSLPVIPRSVSQTQTIVLPVQPMKGQGRAGVRYEVPAYKDPILLPPYLSHLICL